MKSDFQCLKTFEDADNGKVSLMVKKPLTTEALMNTVVPYHAEKKRVIMPG